MSDVPKETLHPMRTAWHELLVVILEHLLAEEWWRLTPEFQLTREAQRIDAVIVRLRDVLGTPPQPTHLRSILGELLRHNVIHFKGPTDELEVADVFQVIAYAAQYMKLEGLTDPAEVSIRVVAAKLTPRFCAQLARMGGALQESEQPGVHLGHLGVFPLRAVETSVAYPLEHEHLLYTLSPAFVTRPAQGPALDDRERFLYYLVCQSVAQLRKDPTWKTTMKDAAIVERSLEEMRRDFFGLYTPEEVAAIARPEQLAKLSPEQRLAGLAPEQRLAGLAPEQRLAGLAPDHVVLALPDDVLRALSDDYLATLPADVQATVRARLAR